MKTSAPPPPTHTHTRLQRCPRLRPCLPRPRTRRVPLVEAKWKYFQHAGALLTADGSDDELIKFEGVPERRISRLGPNSLAKCVVHYTAKKYCKYINIFT